jgi:hypothetical protein
MPMDISHGRIEIMCNIESVAFGVIVLIYSSYKIYTQRIISRADSVTELESIIGRGQMPK